MLCIFVSVVRNRLLYSALNLFFSEKISTILSLLCLLTRVGRCTGILLVDHVFQISFTFSASNTETISSVRALAYQSEREHTSVKYQLARPQSMVCEYECVFCEYRVYKSSEDMRVITSNCNEEV